GELFVRQPGNEEAIFDERHAGNRLRPLFLVFRNVEQVHFREWNVFQRNLADLTGTIDAKDRHTGIRTGAASHCQEHVSCGRIDLHFVDFDILGDRAKQVGDFAGDVLDVQRGLSIACRGVASAQGEYAPADTVADKEYVIWAKGQCPGRLKFRRP